MKIAIDDDGVTTLEPETIPDVRTLLQFVDRAKSLGLGVEMDKEKETMPVTFCIRQRPGPAPGTAKRKKKDEPKAEEPPAGDPKVSKHLPDQPLLPGSESEE